LTANGRGTAIAPRIGHLLLLFADGFMTDEFMADGFVRKEVPWRNVTYWQ
jgi:hypothetical protein